MVSVQQVTGVILCGGHSSRMGFNKAFLKLNDQYVLPQTAATVRRLLPQVVFVTNKKQPFLAQPAFQDYSILEDQWRDCGPLGGLVTALESVTTPYVFLMACDIPHISNALMQPLLTAVTDQQVGLYQQHNRLETLFALYHRSCLPLFKTQLQQGIGQIRYHFKALDVKVIQSNNIELRNINTPAELPGWRIKKIG
jgi:molybdopterin-guanine dinucleotide biosynthesis protein A